jgi:hypothetical protein
MPKIKYVEKKFKDKSLWLIGVANQIIQDYQARGYELTLRQLFYQLVSKDFIANTEKTYKRLGETISNARDAGYIDWDAIIDRTRNREEPSTWSSPESIINVAARQYRIDKWEGQAYRVFVWVEKEALAGVVERACSDEGVQVGYLSCRGYMSSSTIWREAQLIRGIYEKDLTPVILHLGDHDPSGIDMTRDNIERLSLYSNIAEDEFIFNRIALNWGQVERYSPPPNPAKLSDSRASGYVEQFGRQSWELDALDPDVLVALIRDTIDEYRDDEIWDQRVEKEAEERQILARMARNWRKFAEDN